MTEGGLDRSGLPSYAERVRALRQRLGSQTRPGDLELGTKTRSLVDQRPTYGCRQSGRLSSRAAIRQRHNRPTRKRTDRNISWNEYGSALNLGSVAY